MRVSLKWLQDYVNLPMSVQELAKKLTMAGIEVGGIDIVGAGWEGVSVCQVVSLEKHPNADRLLLATLDLGNENITVVTGAPNLEEGQKVPFARVGVELTDGHTGDKVKLKPAKIRGIQSEGMVCSEKELGISDDHTGIMILPPDAPVGSPLAEYLGDTILDCSTTPNRPDCLSVIGIAREVAALTDQAIHIPDISYDEPESPIEEWISIDIDDPELCPRYCASLVTDVKIGPSPQWMQQRLLAGGMRPINNVVDITNYVMLEYGQPLHAFDHKQLKGKKIIVRRAKDDESMYTLDGMKRDLNSDMLVIADESEPVALAGVMGGADSEVIEITTTILLEAASFNGGSIRRTSTKLGLRSEASSRFEKSISPDLAPIGLRRATQLFVELAGGRAAKGIVDVYPGKKDEIPIMLPRERIGRVLGIEFDTARVQAVLSSLGFGSERIGETDDLSVTVPYWRTDIKLPDDVIEEVARIIGYDEIPTTLLRSEIPEHAPAPLLNLKDVIRDLLSGCGMQEVINYSLTSQVMLDRIDPERTISPEFKVANPMSLEQECLRTNLRGGLLACFYTNERHEDNGIRLFEIGKVYYPRGNDLPEEKETLCGLLGGLRSDQSWLSDDSKLDFFDAKGIMETVFNRYRLQADFEPGEDQNMVPGRTAVVTISGKKVGVLGEIHPRILALFDISTQPVILFEVDIKQFLSLVTEEYKYQSIPRYPEIVRDLALVVDAGLPAKNIQGIILSYPMVREVAVFDVYTGDKVPRGKKSLAFSVHFQSLERTLTDEEVSRTEKKIIKRLQEELGATLRS